MQSLNGVGRVIAFIAIFLSISQRLCDGALLVVAPSPFLAYGHNQESVKVKGVNGHLIITVSNPGTLFVSSLHRENDVVTFVANRLGGGDARITLSDDSSAHSVIDVDMNGCTWLAPDLHVLSPSLTDAPPVTLITIDVPLSRNKKQSGAYSVSVSHSIFLRAVKSDSSARDANLGQYRIHVFSANGTDFFSPLEPLRAADLPPWIINPDVSINMYFRARIEGVRKGETYDIQLFHPDAICQPAIVGGGYVF